MSIPRHAHLPGKGRVHVLRIEGDYVTVLTRRDERVYVHRDRLAFLPELTTTNRSTGSNHG